MRNSYNLMRISHFLISLIRTSEKEVITLIEVPVDKGILSLFFKYGWLYVVFLLLCNRFFLPLFTTLQEMGFIFTKRERDTSGVTNPEGRKIPPTYLSRCIQLCWLFYPLAFLQRNSLGMNSLMFVNCSVFLMFDMFEVQFSAKM